jgi:hypothetical protein
MGQVRRLDIALNESGYLRLSTQAWWVQHMGNILSSKYAVNPDSGRSEFSYRNTTRAVETQAVFKSGSLFWRLPAVRRFLQWSHGKTFEILYKN